MGWWSDRAALVIVDAMAVVLARAYRLARARLLNTGSAMLDLLLDRDHHAGEAELLRRELDILRGQREGMSPHRRPDYSPEQRLAIVQLMRLCDWSLKTTASRFVLHENTIRTWRQMIEGKRSSTTLLGIPRWNLIDDAVRWAVQELRRLFPEQEFGSRTIARHLIRAGIAISRRSVQRICREEEYNRPGPRRPKPPLTPPAGTVPDYLLTPETTNRVWHLDLANLHILWLRFSIAVLLDGCSRRLLRLTAYRRAPTSDDMIALMQDTAHEHGRPGFLITDHGCQF